MSTVAAEQTSDKVSPIRRFVASLREPDTAHISPARFSKALHVNIAGLASLTGVHRNTLRNPASERLQERMRQIIRVISAATEVSGDLNKAIYWYRNEPIADYRHKSAAELVAEGHAEAVLAYLRDLESGSSG
jgi:uncharacterized protein (DUF2384 family)